MAGATVFLDTIRIDAEPCWQRNIDVQQRRRPVAACAARISWAGYKTLSLRAGDGDNLITITDAPAVGRATLLGSAGNDTLRAYGYVANLKLDGGADSDSIQWLGSPSSDVVIVDAAAIRFGSVTQTFANVETATVDLHNGNDAVTVASAGEMPWTINGQGGSDALRINAAEANVVFNGGTSPGDGDALVVNAGTHVLTSAAIAASSNLAITVGAAGKVTFSGSTQVPANVGGASALGVEKAVAVESLTVVGELDLGDNALLIRGGEIGTWNGVAYTGLSGLVAAGKITAARTAGVTQTSDGVLIRSTFAGDATNDGAIDGDDFFQIDAGYSTQAIGYGSGDFDYNGVIDADDYFLIDSNFNKASAVAAGTYSSATISSAEGLAATEAVDAPATGLESSASVWVAWPAAGEEFASDGLAGVWERFFEGDFEK